MWKDNVSPTLDRIHVDTRTSLVVMRWLRFLSDRVDPAGLPRLLDYYFRINWISGEMLAELVKIAEGTNGYEPPATDAFVDEDVEDHELLLEKEPVKGLESLVAKEDDAKRGEWRLTPEDHIKSWMFIMELKNEPIDKNALLEVEQRLDSIESNPEALYRI